MLSALAKGATAVARAGLTAGRAVGSATARLASTAGRTISRVGTTSKVLSSVAPKTGVGASRTAGRTTSTATKASTTASKATTTATKATTASRFSQVASGVAMLGTAGSVGYSLLRDVEAIDPNIINTGFSPGDILKMLESLPQQVEQDFSWLENVLGTFGQDAGKILSGGIQDAETIGKDVVWAGEEAFKFAPLILGGVALVMLFGFLR